MRHFPICAIIFLIISYLEFTFQKTVTDTQAINTLINIDIFFIFFFYLSPFLYLLMWYLIDDSIKHKHTWKRIMGQRSRLLCFSSFLATSVYILHEERKTYMSPNWNLFFRIKYMWKESFDINGLLFYANTYTFAHICASDFIGFISYRCFSCIAIGIKWYSFWLWYSCSIYNVIPYLCGKCKEIPLIFYQKISYSSKRHLLLS